MVMINSVPDLNSQYITINISPHSPLTCIFGEGAELCVATIFPLVFTKDAVYVQRFPFRSPRWSIFARWTGFGLAAGTLYFPVLRMCGQVFGGPHLGLITDTPSTRSALVALWGLSWSTVDHIADCLFKLPQLAGTAGWFGGSSGGLFLLQCFP